MASRDNRPADVFQLKTFFLVTGSSKGFGKCVAERISYRLPPGSVVLLLARSITGLESTKRAIENANAGRRITVKIAPTDLSTQDAGDFDRLLSSTLAELEMRPSDFEQAFIVHNAASMGDISKIYSQHNDKQSLQDYWNLTLTSVTALNWAFFKHFPDGSVSQRVAVNISSICGLQPFKSWSLYCAGKAARDMLFRTMALEEPSFRILNYAPGPLDTDMQVAARAETGDPELKQMFVAGWGKGYVVDTFPSLNGSEGKDLIEVGIISSLLHTYIAAEMKAEDRLLKCDDSVKKLEKLLQENTFDSGAHIDYYDLP